MKRGIEVLMVAGLLMLSGCGTINTVLRPDTVTSQGLKDSHSHCDSVPRIYSGVMYGFCYLNSEPKPEKSVEDPTFGQREGNTFPIIVIEGLASGVADTLVLPYTIYRQSKDGSIEIYQ
ncbi:hypothetical protein AZH11_11115 [Pseudomonas simiae]|nr:hypothetical protein AZH11_11115 [Pseudomonas simiae]